MARRLAFACAVGVLGMSAQADPASERGLDGFVSVDRLAVPREAFLKEGRLIWGENCSNCHGGNKATGAPKITSIRAWSARIEQGMDVLIDHALTGFIGPKYTEMPPRGANPDLTDREVAAAVAFMVSVSGGAETVHIYLSSMKGSGQ